MITDLGNGKKELDIFRRFIVDRNLPKYTKAEIIEKVVQKFPETSASTVRTELTDGKNPKYNKWHTLVKESEKGILSF